MMDHNSIPNSDSIPKKKTLTKNLPPHHDVYDATSRSVQLELPPTSSLICGRSHGGGGIKVGSREELPQVAWARAFVVNDLLSGEECRSLIEACDTAGWGNSDVKDEYPPTYRNNERLITIHKPLADALFRRLMHHFTDVELVGCKPQGWGAEGVWLPVGLNDCFIFSRYKDGAFFSKHFDGHYKDLNARISIFTVSVYLCDVPEANGGALVFYEGDRAQNRECARWQPRMGSAVIFTHDVLHEGAPTNFGSDDPNSCKILFRTSVMFERVSDLSAAVIVDPRLDKMRSIFAHFDLFRSLEDPELFTKKFLEAQELQLAGGRTSWVYEKRNAWPWLTRDIAAILALHLGAKGVLTLAATCKSLYLVFRGGFVWREVFQKVFGAAAARMCNPLDLPPACIDWYHAFVAGAQLARGGLEPSVLFASNLVFLVSRAHSEIRDDIVVTSKCVVQYEYDGWDAAIKNWFLTSFEEGDDCDPFFGPVEFREPTLYKPPAALSTLREEIWLRPLGERLVSSRDSIAGYQEFLSDVQGYQPALVLDVIWPHWYGWAGGKARTEPPGSTPVMTLYSPYCRRLEYFDTVMNGVVSRSKVCALGLLEAPAAALMSRGGRATGKVLCVSARGALVPYQYEDAQPIDVKEESKSFGTWRELWEDYDDDPIVTEADVVVSDLQQNELCPERLESFALFVSALAKKWGKAYIEGREILDGAQTFSRNTSLMWKAIVWTSPRFHGILNNDNLISGSITESIAKDRKLKLCGDFALKGQCPIRWNCKKRHTLACPTQRTNPTTFCLAHHFAACPFPHLSHHPCVPSCYQCHKDALKLIKCSACKTATYCSAECQKKHWPVHKGECKKK